MQASKLLNQTGSFLQFSGKIPKSLAVRVGSSEHSRGGKVVKVKRIIQHDKFVSPIHEFDFALLELSEKLIYTAKIEAIQLPNEYDSFQDGSPCFVSGWGNKLHLNKKINY